MNELLCREEHPPSDQKMTDAAGGVTANRLSECVFMKGEESTVTKTNLGILATGTITNPALVA